MTDFVTLAHVALALAGYGVFMRGFWIGECGPLPKACGLMLLGTAMTVAGLIP